MAESSNWSFPENVQPNPADVRFDLDAVLDAVVMLRAEIPEDAFTASILGTERVGNGVAIRTDGLVLTIGYLIAEAQTIWLTTNSGTAVPAYPLAYDQASGFGLVQPLGRLDVPVLERGSAASCAVGDDVIMIGHGGRAHALKAKVIAKREFAGYWEYVLDEAVFTAPAHPQWGGAALVGGDGRLLGIGSLLVEETVQGQTIQGNMVVPIDPLEPIFDDMLAMGRANRTPRPWLGMYTTEANGQLTVAGLADGGPAELAGVRQGDLVLEVAGERVTKLADLFRKVWRLGPAGTEIPLTLAREGELLRVQLRSADRSDFLKKPSLH
ncbi:MAG TPA: S1C family serine protease [Burkholderiales bacterium]|nr:S1C family serine protease [Burkholderiales bacterium]